MARFAFFLSGSVAIFIYASLVFLLVWRLSVVEKIPKAYTAFKETAFSIELLEIKSEVKKIPQRKAEKKIEKIPQKKEAASKTANAGVGINDLFKQVESKKPVQHTKPSSQNDEIAKKKKAKESSQKETLDNELDKIMANLDTQKTLSFSTPKGEFDEFYAKVHEILAKNWNPISTRVERVALVQITIDSLGRFSYFIQKASDDADFDNALQDFLDIMRTLEFPRFEGGSQTTIMVTFKTEV